MSRLLHLAGICAALVVCFLVLTQGCSWNRPEKNDTANGNPGNVAGTRQINPPLNFAPYSPAAIYAGLQRNTFSKTGYDTDPDISRDGQWIVYVSDSHSGNPDIFLKKLNGEAIVQKTTSASNDVQPCFSPDGKNIAFSSDRNGKYDIFIMPTDKNGSLWQVTRSTADAVSPSWSPDGKKLAYCAKTPRGDWEIWIADLNTQSLTNLGPGMNPKWHPTQNLILFQRPYYSGALSYSIYTIDTEGKNLTLLVRGDRWVPTNAAWSTDGARIAFAARGNADGLATVAPLTKANDIWMINADGSQELRVTEGPGQNWRPTWAKIGDEEKIFFVSDKDNQTNIWSLNCGKFQIEE